MGSDLLDNLVRETELGPLPNEWEVTPFGDAVEFESGQVDPREKPYSDMVHVGPENIAEASGKLLECKTAKELNLISGKYLFTSKDVIYSKIRPYLRKVALPSFDGLCSADMYPLRPKDSTLHREFLYFWMLSNSFTEQAVPFQARTGIPKINRQQLLTTKVIQPPIFEQRAIAHVLRTVQQTKEATEKIIAAARQLKQSLMRHLFTYGPVSVEKADKVVLKETEIGVFPEHWTAQPLSELVVKKITDGTHKTPKYTLEGVPFITAKDIHGGRVDFSDCKFISQEEHAQLIKRCHPERGNILLSKVGTIGLVTEIKDTPEFSIFVQLALIKPNQSKVLSSYLTHCLSSSAVQQEIERTSAQSTMKYIGVGKIGELCVPIPSPQEQWEIAAALCTTEKKVDTEMAKRDALDILFKTLLHHLMTGKVRVNHLKFPATEVAP